MNATDNETTVLEWNNADCEDPDEIQFQWDDMLDELTDILREINPSGLWYGVVINFGWRKRDGTATFSAVTGSDFLLGILPITDCSFKIYRDENGIISINNAHHDSPYWDEWYYICENTEETIRAMFKAYNL